MADLRGPDNALASPPDAAPRGGATDLWAPREPAPEVTYPTRMARRRALDPDGVRNEWQPGPGITAPVLAAVQTALLTPEVVPAVARPTRRRRRRVALVAGACALALLAAGGGAAAWWTSRPVDRPVAAPAGTPAPAAERSSLLLLVDDAQVTGAVLVVGEGQGPGRSVQQVLLPSRLLLDVAGVGRLPLATALLAGPSAVGGAIGGALGVRVDTTTVLDDTGLAALVDAAGGVVVDVEVDVTSVDTAGTTTVELSAGPAQRLTGAQAVTYASYLASDEPEAGRLARQQRVVDALVDALPADADAVAELLRKLSPVPADVRGVAAHLVAVGEAAQRDAVSSTVVPTREIETGGAVTYYGLDVRAAAALVDDRLRGAVLAADDSAAATVLVQNGLGTPGLGEVARARLARDGHRFVGGGNVVGFGQEESLVVIRSSEAADRSRGLAVARSLRLPDTALRIGEAPPPGVDLVVILGSDFPATDPAPGPSAEATGPAGDEASAGGGGAGGRPRP